MSTTTYTAQTSYDTSVDRIADCAVFAQPQSRTTRAVILAAAALAGVAAAITSSSFVPSTYSIAGLLLGLAFLGGLLSTWSPCGYSSLCLLRPAGRYSARSVMNYVPTFVVHGLGYAVGALMLGGALGVAGYLLSLDRLMAGGTVVLAVLAVMYGIHQLGFLKMPYPQRRAQVPHDARQRFPMWVVGLIYGLALGLDYLTYVQTPILYIVTGAALLSGEIGVAIGLVALFNLGRFLPMLVTLLPIPDRAVQDWLARRQEKAAAFDGFLLVFAGSAVLTLCAL